MTAAAIRAAAVVVDAVVEAVVAAADRVDQVDPVVIADRVVRVAIVSAVHVMPPIAGRAWIVGTTVRRMATAVIAATVRIARIVQTVPIVRSAVVVAAVASARAKASVVRTWRGNRRSIAPS